MAKVRVLVGTRKGAFVITSDESRRDWKIEGPHFGGWEVMHMKGSPANPDRIYASQWTDWHGQVVQRSDDGGQSWEPVGNEFAYSGDPGTHQWYDGTPHPWDFKRVWHFEPSPNDPEIVHAGVEDAGLFRSSDGGRSWTELPTLRTHSHGNDWMPGAGGLCLHTILIDPRNERRMYVAISAAGAFRTDDGGESWKVATRGLSSNFLPKPEAEVGHCVHNLAMHPSRPDTVFMQKHWDVCRTDDAGETWHEVSGNLPSDFGFPIVVHAHEPETIYVVPILSDSEHYPPDGRLRVYRSRTGGNEWEALTRGLPQHDVFVNILRDAMSVDSLDSCGIYFGTTGGQVYASADSGDNWQAIAEHLPPVLSVEVQTLPVTMIKVALPVHLRTLARVDDDVEVAVSGAVSPQSVLDALELSYPMLRGTIREHGSGKRRAYMRYFADGEDVSHEDPDTPLPEAVMSGQEPFVVIGAISGG